MIPNILDSYPPDFKSLKESKQTFLTFVVRFVVTQRNIRIKQEDIYIKSKQIQTLSVITVVRVLSFNNFLKQIDTSLHKQYTMEKFKEGFAGGRNFVVEEPKFEFKKPVFKKKLDLPRADEVPIAKEYLEKRKLDPSKFYFAYKFKEWTNTQKQTFDTIGRDESRIIIPMYDEDKILIGFQGRSLGPNSVKYITVMINEDAPKIYGLDQIDNEKPIYIIEGPFDATLVQNAVAMCETPILILGRLVGAIIFTFMIMNLATEKSSTESPKPSIEETK